MIVLERASRWYGQILGLNDVSCTFPAGITAVLGPNGAGKSTMLKLITGQIRPSAGRVTVLGENPFANPRVFRSLGYCPELENSYDDMTGREMVTMLAAMSGLSGARLRERVGATIDRVGMTDAADRRVGGYSKGMRQRIKLAQGIVHEPRVLVLDEPLNGLDPVGRRQVAGLLRELSAAGSCVLVSSHILHEVEQLTENILLMDRGRVLARGNLYVIRSLIDSHPHRIMLHAADGRALAKRLLDFPSVLSIRLHTPDAAQLEVETRKPEEFYNAFPDLVLQDGFQVSSMESFDNNLEAVFRYLVGEHALSDLYLFRSTLLSMLRPKQLAAAGLLTVLPALVALIWRWSAVSRHGEFPAGAVYDELSALVVFGFVMVILAVVFATGVLTEEVERKTIVYLLSRPEPRWRILLVKFLAAGVVITGCLWVCAVLLASAVRGAAAFSQPHLGRDLVILPIGALVYGALFLMVATILNRPLLIGLLYAFGWESWAANLPGNFARLSLMAYLRVLSPHAQPQAETVDASSLLGSLASTTISFQASVWVVGCMIALSLVTALVIFSVREYVPRDDG